MWLLAGTYCIKVKAKDMGDNESGWSGELCVEIGGGTNNPPEIPRTPSGLTTGSPGIEYVYLTSTADPDDDRVKYGFEWTGDEVVDGWTRLYNSEDLCYAEIVFSSSGTYHLRVKAEDESGLQSDFSEPLIVTIAEDCSEFMGFTVCPLGEAELEIGDELIVSNIGDSGEDGVDIDAAGHPRKKIRIDLKEEPEARVDTRIRTTADDGKEGQEIKMQQKKKNEDQWEIGIVIPDAISAPSMLCVTAFGPEDDLVFYKEIEVSSGWYDLGIFGTNTTTDSMFTPDTGPYGMSASNMEDAGIVGWHTQDGKEVTWICEELGVAAMQLKRLDAKIRKEQKGELEKAKIEKGHPQPGKGQMTIKSITSKEIVQPTKPTITGETSGKPEVEYSYTIKNTGTEPAYLIIDWGDNSNIEWTRRQEQPNKENTLKHKYAKEGTYTIKTKALNSDIIDSEWEMLEVSMPRIKTYNIFNPLIFRLIQRFPILELLL